MIHSTRRSLVIFALVAIAALTALPALGEDPLLGWIDTPEGYFATPEERTAWYRDVRTTGEAERFIEAFWQRRGVEFRKEVLGRVAYADQHFSLKSKKGSLTERGRVFIILGPPNEQLRRSTAASQHSLGAQLTSTRWTYRKERLPSELGVPELTVRFQTDEFHGAETIENLGVVEPVLAKTTTVLAQSSKAPASAVPAAADPLWDAKGDERGVIYTGESFVSPTDVPFYAISAFIPSGTTGLEESTGMTMVSLVRDASGRDVVSERRALDATAYDDRGSRHLDWAIVLPAGSYEGMFALLAPDGSTVLSSHRRSFEIAPAEEPRVSQLFLTARMDTLESQDAFDPFTFVATRYAVRGDRSFKAADPIGFFTVIANPAGSPAPRLMQKMTLTRDGKPFFSSPVEPAAPVQTGPNTFLVGVSFGPGAFEPGHYALQVEIRELDAPEESALRSPGHRLAAEFDVTP